MKSWLSVLYVAWFACGLIAHAFGIWRAHWFRIQHPEMCDPDAPIDHWQGISVSLIAGPIGVVVCVCEFVQIIKMVANTKDDQKAPDDLAK